MIQILALRDGGTRFYEQKWREDSVAKLFEGLDYHIAKIPPKERYNIFYTLANCKEGSRAREFSYQKVIAFDIDKIDITNIESYIAPVLEALGVNRGECAIVYSGNGLHFLINCAQSFSNKDYFKKYKEHYRILCERINHRIKLAGLTGKADPAIFDAARILRLPDTENRKPNKENKQAKLIDMGMPEINWSLETAVDLPAVPIKEQISPRQFANFPPVDKSGVLQGCNFLKWCKENPADVEEPLWYAMMSITGNLEGGEELTHEYSSGHPDYNVDNTTEKLAKALLASGPRTCSNINYLWGKCNKCPNYNKVTSPICVQGEDFIPTESTGFHKQVIKANGSVSYKPQFLDLVKYYDKFHAHATVDSSRVVYKYEDNYWKEVYNANIEGFAQDNFNPKPEYNNIAVEFRKLMERTALMPIQFFTESIFRKMNFENGVLDIKSMELEPHNKKYGFRAKLPYDYDPTAEAPRFKKFLEEIMDGDEERIQVLLEYGGYALANEDPEWGQKALILLGEGANGKSVFLDVIKWCAGSENTSTCSLTDIKDERNRCLAEGKLVNVADETPSKGMLDSSIFKAWVTGGYITFRKMYKDAHVAKATAKLLFSTNDLPANIDLSHGMFRRLLIVPFNRRFEGEEEDKGLRSKLKEELPGIFNLFIKAYAELKERGHFTDAKVVRDEIGEYKKSSDQVALWLDENVNLDGNKDYAIEDMYRKYKSSMEEMGYRPYQANKFYKQLTRLMPKSKKDRRQINGRRVRMYTGIEITSFADVIDLNY